MPKKFKGENSKAVEARNRKADAKAEAEARKQKEVEDALWRDDDKHAKKKVQRKAEREHKRQEELARKLENKKLFEEEDMATKGPNKAGSAKLTRTQIEANKRRMEMERAAAQAATQAQPSHLETPLEENPNLILAAEAGEGVVSARNVEEAISALSIGESSLEKHPEKRVKAAYISYEETRLPILKAENPNMRLSQLKQMLKKDWMKSPENPMNQRFQSYNTKK